MMTAYVINKKMMNLCEINSWEELCQPMDRVDGVSIVFKIKGSRQALADPGMSSLHIWINY